MGRSRNKSRYDSYRPADDVRTEVHRGLLDRDVSKDQKFWRREQPEERQSGHPSTDNDHSIVSNTSSSVDQLHFREHIARPRANSIASMPVDTSVMARRPSFSHHETSTTNQLSISPITQTSTLASVHPNSDTPLDATTTQSAAHGSATMKASDPRLSRHHREGDSRPTIIKAATNMLLEQERTTVNAGHLMTGLATAGVALHEGQKELKAMSVKLTRLEDEVKAVKAKLPRKVHAPYTDTIIQEARILRGEIGAKEIQVKALAEKEEAAREALMEFHETKQTSNVDVENLKQQLGEQRDRSRRLEDSNERLQRQVDQMSQVITDLKDLVTNTTREAAQSASEIKANKEQLSNLERVIKATSQDEIEPLRGEIKAQKLVTAKLNDVFVAKEDHTRLNSRVDEIHQRVTTLRAPSQTSSDKYISQDQLDSYITIFNLFETKMENRLQNLETQLSIGSGNAGASTRIASLEKQIDSFSTDHMYLEELGKRVNTLESGAQELRDTVDVYIEKDTQVQTSIKASAHKVRELSQRTKALEEQPRTLAAPETQLEEKLQQDIRSLQDMYKNLEQVNKASIHSIGSLSQRFNNLGTDHLVRQMVNVLEPMLKTVKPQLTQLQAAFKQLQNQQNDAIQRTEANLSRFQTLLDETLRGNETPKFDLSQIKKDTGELRSKYEKDYQTVQSDLELVQNQLISHQKSIEDAIGKSHSVLKSTVATHTDKVQAVKDQLHKLQEEMDRNKAEEASSLAQAKEELQASIARVESSLGDKLSDDIKATRDTYEDTINSFRREQQASHTTLTDQVREARNVFDARLLVIEKKVLKGENTASEVVTKSSTPPTSGIPKISLDKATPRRSNNSPATKPPKTKLLQTSSLIKHFPSRIIEEDIEDTIDATPKGGKSIKKVADHDFFVISDSDHDASMGPDDETHEEDIAVNLEMWKKDYVSRPKSPSIDRSKRATPVFASKSREVHTSSRGVSMPKRKREQSSTTPKSSQNSNGDASGVAGRKKPKT